MKSSFSYCSYAKNPCLLHWTAISVSVPRAFSVPCPVPFPVPFHGLRAPASDFAMSLTFFGLKKKLFFLLQQHLLETNFSWQGHEKVQKALEKALEKALKRHWKGTGGRHGTWQQ